MNCPNKLVLAALIKEKRDILFGKFTNTITHEVKNREWKQILSNLNAQGMFAGKDYKYLRDVAWQNIKRATMKKIDKSKRTGAVRRRNCVLNNVDKIVLDIFGNENESKIVKGGIDESSSILSEDVAVLPMNVNIENDEDEEEDEHHQDKKLPKTSGKMDLKRTDTSRNLEEDILFLKRKKLQLEVYNLQLDAIKKELELGLPSSNLTAEVEKESQSELTSIPSEGIANLNDFRKYK